MSVTSTQIEQGATARRHARRPELFYVPAALLSHSPGVSGDEEARDLWAALKKRDGVRRIVDAAGGGAVQGSYLPSQAIADILLLHALDGGTDERREKKPAEDHAREDPFCPPAPPSGSAEKAADQRPRPPAPALPVATTSPLGGPALVPTRRNLPPAVLASDDAPQGVLSLMQPWNAHFWEAHEEGVPYAPIQVHLVKSARSRPAVPPPFLNGVCDLAAGATEDDEPDEILIATFSLKTNRRLLREFRAAAAVPGPSDRSDAQSTTAHRRAAKRARSE